MWYNGIQRWNLCRFSEFLPSETPFHKKGSRSKMRNTAPPPPSEDQKQLIALAQEGDQTAFEELLDSYAPLIDSMTGRFSAPPTSLLDREDLRQEAVLGFYRAVMHFDTQRQNIQFGVYVRSATKTWFFWKTAPMKSRNFATMTTL